MSRSKIVIATIVAANAWAQPATPPPARVDFHSPAGCLTPLFPDADAQVVDNLRRGFKPFFPDVQVLSECAGGSADPRQQYGVWEHSVSGTEEGARRTLLKSLPTIREKKSGGAMEDFAAHFSAGLIDDAVNHKLTQMKATPINGQGMSETGWFGDVFVGNITIENWNGVALVAPNNISLGVQASVQIEVTPPGFGYFPYDIDFGISDTLSLHHKDIHPESSCGTNNQIVSCSHEGSYEVPDLFKSGSTTAVPAIGCPFASGLPVTQPLPPIGAGPPQKIVFNYGRSHVDAKGIDAGASIKLCNRAPAARMGGPNVVNLTKGHTTGEVSVSITTSDMRPPLSVEFGGFTTKVNGTHFQVGRSVSGPSSATSGPAEVGLKAHITDADGLKADATGTAVVYPANYAEVQQQKPCIAKPYLPNCHH